MALSPAGPSLRYRARQGPQAEGARGKEGRVAGETAGARNKRGDRMTSGTAALLGFSVGFALGGVAVSLTVPETPLPDGS